MRSAATIVMMFIFVHANAQVVNGTLDKLASKYADRNFEWVLKKAEALMEDNVLKKSPEPYMWAAMCHFELYRSDDAKVRDLNKGGLREALKYAAKAATKDKDGEFVEAQREFLNELKGQGVALAQQYLASQDVRKANHVYKQILSFNPTDDNIHFVKGVTDIQMNNLVEAEKAIAESLPRIESNYRDLSFKPDPISLPLLREAVMYYIDHLAMNNRTDSARHAAFVGRIIFPLDEGIKQKAESFK
jgi:hypothetical protein